MTQHPNFLSRALWSVAGIVFGGMVGGYVCLGPYGSAVGQQPGEQNPTPAPVATVTPRSTATPTTTPTSTTTPVPDAFGGFFERFQNDAEDCRIKNPLTNDCICPTGYDETRLSEFFDFHTKYYCKGEGGCGVNRYMCTRHGSGSFGGAFRKYHSGECTDKNPLTGGCFCGEGFKEEVIDEFTESGCEYYNSASNIAVNNCGMQVFVCRSKTTPPSGKYGGNFRKYKDGSCGNTNPYTGFCDCPPGGYLPYMISEFTDLHRRYYCTGDGICGIEGYVCMNLQNR